MNSDCCDDDGDHSRCLNRILIPDVVAILTRFLDFISLTLLHGCCGNRDLVKRFSLHLTHLKIGDKILTNQWYQSDEIADSVGFGRLLQRSPTIRIPFYDDAHFISSFTGLRSLDLVWPSSSFDIGLIVDNCRQLEELTLQFEIRAHWKTFNRYFAISMINTGCDQDLPLKRLRRLSLNAQEFNQETSFTNAGSVFLLANLSQHVELNSLELIGYVRPRPIMLPSTLTELILHLRLYFTRREFDTQLQFASMRSSWIDFINRSKNLVVVSLLTPDEFSIQKTIISYLPDVLDKLCLLFPHYDPDELSDSRLEPGDYQYRPSKFVQLMLSQSNRKTMNEKEEHAENEDQNGARGRGTRDERKNTKRRNLASNTVHRLPPQRVSSRHSAAIVGTNTSRTRRKASTKSSSSRSGSQLLRRDDGEHGDDEEKVPAYQFNKKRLPENYLCHSLTELDVTSLWPGLEFDYARACPNLVRLHIHVSHHLSDRIPENCAMKLPTTLKILDVGEMFNIHLMPILPSGLTELRARYFVYDSNHYPVYLYSKKHGGSLRKLSDYALNDLLSSLPKSLTKIGWEMSSRTNHAPDDMEDWDGYKDPSELYAVGLSSYHMSLLPADIKELKTHAFNCFMENPGKMSIHHSDHDNDHIAARSINKDRSKIVNCSVIPRSVEHCLVAISDICEQLRELPSSLTCLKVFELFDPYQISLFGDVFSGNDTTGFDQIDIFYESVLTYLEVHRTLTSVHNAFPVVAAEIGKSQMLEVLKTLPQSRLEAGDRGGGKRYMDPSHYVATHCSKLVKFKLHLLSLSVERIIVDPQDYVSKSLQKLRVTVERSRLDPGISGFVFCNEGLHCLRNLRTIKLKNVTVRPEFWLNLGTCLSVLELLDCCLVPIASADLSIVDHDCMKNTDVQVPIAAINSASPSFKAVESDDSKCEHQGVGRCSYLLRYFETKHVQQIKTIGSHTMDHDFHLRIQTQPCSSKIRNNLVSDLLHLVKSLTCTSVVLMEKEKVDIVHPSHLFSVCEQALPQIRWDDESSHQYVIRRLMY